MVCGAAQLSSNSDIFVWYFTNQGFGDWNVWLECLFLKVAMVVEFSCLEESCSMGIRNKENFIENEMT